MDDAFAGPLGPPRPKKSTAPKWHAGAPAAGAPNAGPASSPHPKNTGSHLFHLRLRSLPALPLHALPLSAPTIATTAPKPPPPAATSPAPRRPAAQTARASAPRSRGAGRGRSRGARKSCRAPGRRGSTRLRLLDSRPPSRQAPGR